MPIRIDAYNEQEEGSVRKLFTRSFENENLFTLLKKPRSEFAYSAYINEQLTGVIFGWKSGFHPNCTYFRIVIDPIVPSDGIIKDLLVQTATREQLQYPLQTSICETAFALKIAYEKEGFVEIRRTYISDLDLSFAVGDELPLETTERLVVKCLETLSEDEVQQLVRLVKRVYKETHSVNPVADKGIQEWEQLVFAEDTIAEGSLVYVNVDTHQVLAYSFLHESDREGVYELGWCGYLDDQYKSLLPQLVIHQIQYSVTLNIHTLTGEFDTTDPYAMEVLKRFPFAPCPALITYQKRDDKQQA
ncbi:hypothetical protein PGH26_07480 [Sporosarcina jeotgali]|uniref:GNAT family acetyltransferase n=1 Tax=Sporosarcina jeotgali TaxID=3020056 RepID=A0ABZ0KZG0_9BACL|nr:hypothetical protein [Sporosarcina sp. B2O-1]WOV85765.1 hypothetical protein PGH26_07480 [Sporosarcina sp. B2O-1]